MDARIAIAPLLLLALAGCLVTEGEAVEPRYPPFDPATIAPGVDWWEDFATRWVKRDAYLPQNEEVKDYLVGEMETLGFDVEVREYPGREQGIDLPPIGPLKLHAIIATKTGLTQPDRAIGLVSHYDTQTLTFQGAYDDASGVAAQFTICKALAELPLDKTLVCIFFDGEERGLVAADHFVQDAVVGGNAPYTFDFVLGYDMTGINWPGHDWKMYVMTGGEEYVPVLGDFARRIMHQELGYPEDGVEVLDVHDRNSDERRFREAGVPIFRFAGGRHAVDYPQYHLPLDTVDYVYDFVGGRANFEAGFGTIVEGSYHLVLALDGTDWDTMLAEHL
jgi:hypothetical protein